MSDPYRACFVTDAGPRQNVTRSRPPFGPRALPTRSGPELGASPRWSRPASPTRVNGLGCGDGPKHLFAFVASHSPTFGARPIRSLAAMTSSPSEARASSDVESFAVFFYQPAQGAFATSAPAIGRCPLTRTAVRSVRGADLRCHRSGTFALLPRSPLPGTLVTAPGSSRFGPPRHRPNRSRPS